MSPGLAAIIGVSGSLGYALPAIVGLESMGVPSPGELALGTAAILASQGKLSIVLVLLIAAASAIAGDNVGYWIGRKLGREVLTHAGPLHAHRVRAVDAADSFFDRHGSKAVFLGRWVSLLRVSAAWMAGISGMRFRVFFLWNALGGISWTIVVGLAAYFAGHAAIDVLSKIGVYGAIAAGIAVLAAILIIRRRRGSAARARRS